MSRDNESPESDLDEIFDHETQSESNDKWIRLRENKFSHNVFGDALIEEYSIITVNDRIYIYEDGYYQQDENAVKRKMLEVFPAIKNQQRAEVLSYIKIQTELSREEIHNDPYIINLKNTRLDVRSGKMLTFDPEVIEFERIPVEYDPTAYNADLDRMLKRVFKNDPEIFDLFGEMIGYCLIRNCNYGKIFMLYGSGSNGKSTILDLIKIFIGRRNYCSIELDKLTATFSTAELENKLVNIGDDINASGLRDTGTLKKIFTGNSLQVQRKGERPFDLEPYAKHIYSCNELPHFQDKSDGMYRRLALIPFTAKFTRTDPDYDPMIKEKIFTDNAISYLLNIALEGVQRLIKNGGFTEPESVTKALEEYKIDNSTVISWIFDAGHNKDYILSKSAPELYSNFSDWCKLSGIKNIPTSKTFNKEIRSYFVLETKQQWITNEKGERLSKKIFFVDSCPT